MDLPSSAIEWLESEGVDPADATHALTRRFFRIGHDPSAELLRGICADVGCPTEDIQPVEWLPPPLRFFSLPADAPLAQAKAYRDGLIQVLK